MIGKKVWEPSPLERSSVQAIFHKVKTGSGGLRDMIYNLQTIRTVSEENYHQAKRELPFFTLSVFHPPYRKTQNFAAANGMVIDIDNLNVQDAEFDRIRQRIRREPTTCMEFISPGHRGIKVILLFEYQMKDAALFSTFYKKYIYQWARRLDVLDVIDFSTHDAARATFFSYDPSVYFNPKAEKINATSWLDHHDPSIFESDQKNTFQNPTDSPSPTDTKKEKKRKQDLKSETLLAIRNRLKKNKMDQPKKIHHDPNIYVPDEIESSLPKIEQQLKDFDIQLIETHPIQYGRKIKVGIPNAWAEVNVFYGKKGYSIVATTKRNSDQELAQMTREVLSKLLLL